MTLRLKDKGILVAGGAGFIGSHLVDRVAQEEPHCLVVVDNLFLGKEENLQDAKRMYPELKLYVEDASDIRVMQKILNDHAIDVVYNLAVVPLPASLERPKWTVDANVAITTTLCELARQHAYETLIHFSSSEVYGTAQYVPMDENHPLVPLTPYAASKAGSDHVVLSYCHTFGIDAAIIRPFNNFGPRQNDGSYAGIIPIVLGNILSGRTIEIYGDGEQTRDFIFVSETAEAAVAVYEEEATRGRVINIASGQEVSVKRLVQTILELAGCKRPPVRHTAPRPGDVRRHCGAIGVARNLIGFQPKVPLEDGLKQTVDWYMKRRGYEKRTTHHSTHR